MQKLKGMILRRKWLKLLLLVFLFVFSLASTLFISLYHPAVQQFAANQTASYFSKQLNAKIELSGVKFTMFHFLLEDFYLEDRNGDTLIYAEELSLNYDALQLFKRKIITDNIGLKNASIYLHKETIDDDFNYRFLFDHFVRSKGIDENSSNWQIKLRKLDFDNVTFQYYDRSAGQETDIFLKRAHLLIDQSDLPGKVIVVENAIVYGAAITHTQLAGRDREFTETRETTDFDVVHFNKANWDISLNHLELINSNVDYNNLSFTRKDHDAFDENYISISDLNLQMSDVYLVTDTVTGIIRGMEFKEKNGFEVTNMNAGVVFSRGEWKFEDMLIETPFSRIQDRFSFTYNSLIEFYDFIPNVFLRATFSESLIGKEDLRYFVPSLPATNENYLISGRLSGTVNDLSVRDLDLQYGADTRFKGHFSMFGLPRINETLIDFYVEELYTTAREFEEIIPIVNLPGQVDQFGKVKFTGNFVGAINDFVAYGQMNTALGLLSSDINMKIDPETGHSSYSGKLAANDFHLGKWLNEPEIGRSTFQVELKGNGLEWHALQANLQGNFDKIDIRGYDYKAIHFSGDIQRRFFSGVMDIKDENLDMSFNGTINFQEKVPVFQLQSDINFADLNALKLVEAEYRVKTSMVLDFSGDNIDNIEGTAKLSNTVLFHGEETYYLENVNFISSNTMAGKKFSLLTDVAELNITGRYNIAELPDAILAVTGHYYPSLPGNVSSNTLQDFEFDFIILEDNSLTELFIPYLKGKANTSFSGKIDNRRNLIHLKAWLPGIDYHDVIGQGLNIEVTTGNDSLSISADINSIFFKGAEYYANKIDISVYNDLANWEVKIAEPEASSRLRAMGILNHNKDTLNVQILDSEVVLDQKKWTVGTQNRFSLIDKQFFIENLELKNDEEVLTIHASTNEKHQSSLFIDFANIDIESFTGIIHYDQFDLGGKATGNINIIDFFNEVRLFVGDFIIDDFLFERKDIGLLTYKGSYHPLISKLDIRGNIQGHNANADIRGHIFTDGREEALFLNTDINQVPFHLLEPFLEEIASNLKGYGKGKVGIRGNPQNIRMNGDMMIYDASGKIDYLNTSLFFDPVKVNFTHNSIYISNTTVRDKNGVTAQAGGEIWIGNFSELRFEDVYLYTSPNFLVLNTSKQDNEYFYGTAYAQGIALINGPINDVDIYVNARSNPNSRLFIPLESEGNVSNHEFIRFRSRADTEVPVPVGRRNQGLKLNMDLDFTRDAEMQLIFDEKAGDIIKGRGEGNLKVSLNTSGDFQMFGSYNIHEGEYLFTLQEIFVNKKFDIESGGTITWTGNPYEAQLNLNAIYRLRASKYDLVKDLMENAHEEDRKRLKQLSPVDVYMHLTGPLLAPEIEFDITLPLESTYTFDNTFNRRLREVQSDENELNKQVFGLIVFGRFLPVEVNPASDAMFTATGINTVTEFLSNQLSIYFTDWLAKYDMEVNLQYRSYDYETINNDLHVTNLFRNELELELRKRINRVSINVGTNIDFGRTSSDLARTNHIGGEFEVEYFLTEDGRLRVKAFYINDIDIFEDRNRNRTGIGFFYRKDFDNLSELLDFLRRTRKEEEESETEEESPEFIEDEKPLPLPDISPDIISSE